MKHSVRAGLIRTGEATANVRLRVSYAGRRVDVYPGISTDPSKWRDGRAGGQGAQETNRRIAAAVASIDGLFARLELLNGRQPAPDEIRELFSHSAKAACRTVRDSVEEFSRQEGARAGWSMSTYRKFRTLANHFEDFDPGASLDDIDDMWLGALLRHLQRGGMRNTTCAKNMKLARWFLSWASRHNMYSGTSHLTFRPKLKGQGGVSEIVYLEWEEVEALAAHPFTGALEETRDMFLFQCLTGLRYSDLKKLRPQDIRDGKMYVVTEKTADPLIIELNAAARSLVAKYSGCAKTAFPVKSNQKYNGHIHEMCRIAGLTRPVRRVWFRGGTRFEEDGRLWEYATSHAARRTFVVRCMTLKIPATVIMEWTGHSDFDAMKPYMKVVDSLKEREMMKFDAPGFAPENGNGNGG